ncbi:TniQ family protein [Streptomyces phaeolivaceus]|uniref:TniQ family protein n=1 Tax=Streptomyces phaeolivaceus TaxID=2653200 RepID=A0A5P8K533_9ACTN|nr:TniQ family protein [Streptomyces phaeolivaceus]QFQ98375.1 TniQ family protein [Streptomyces phaeolivaceus]
MRALPRSLDPLPDEALTGYILRLAHRLGTSPGAIAIWTGLTGGRKENVLFRIPMRLLHDLEPGQVRLFSRTTRLSPDEIGRLVTSSFAGRYGPANRRFTPRSSAARMINDNAWLLTRTPRYCPQCLTGDRSEIQRRHGGAWRLSWRLPPVFACPRHRRLLRTNCPACRQPVHAVEMNSIIARPWDEDLHPTQCRTTIAPRTVGRLQSACGAQLAEPVGAGPEIAPDPQTLEHLLGLQRRLLKLLDPVGPAVTPSVGWLIPAADYFADLRALLGLVFLSWPAARSFAATPALAEAIDREAEERLARAAALRDRPGKKHSSRPFTDPPLDPFLMGAVLGIAERLLDAPDEEQARELMLPLIHQASCVDQALSIYLRREAWVSFPLRIVSMNRPKSMMAMGDIIARGPIPKGDGSGARSEGYRRREPW